MLFSLFYWPFLFKMISKKWEVAGFELTRNSKVPCTISKAAANLGDLRKLWFPLNASVQEN